MLFSKVALVIKKSLLLKGVNCRLLCVDVCFKRQTDAVFSKSVSDTHTDNNDYCNPLGMHTEG